ncbi:pimeloyl-ACP methyl ester esterase BioH [Dokdonella sp.]|uniref:pimeloyl-ACP methyl ester esterase BioH n=1 Tax=Dokdonella sp. TaxID=2291710 RepID=UPI003C612F36
MSPHIRVTGAGPDLVLIHGWAMHGGIFAPLAELLEQHFRLHLVDLPGHGHSREFESGSLDPGRLASAIAARTPPALWLGWSLGGLIALRAALDIPNQVPGLIEVASSPRFVRDDDWPHAVSAGIFREFGSALVEGFRPTIERFLALETLGSAHAQEELRNLKAHVFERGEPSVDALQEGLDVLEAFDARGELARLGMPSLWIAGRRDRLVTPASMRWAATQCPSGEYLELPSAHAPFLSDPDRVASAIMAFSDSLVPA